MGEVIAYLDPGADITVEVGGGNAAVGGELCGYPTAVNAGGYAGISDTGDGTPICPRVTAATGTVPVLGVFSHDAAVGKKVNVMRAPKVVPCLVGAANAGVIGVGVEVQADANGRVIAFAPGAAISPIGANLGAATSAAGQFCKTLLYAVGSVKNA